MSTFHTGLQPCPRCATPIEVAFVESANVARSRHYHDMVIDGSLMSHVCNRCGHRFRFEHELLYTDLEHGLFIMAFPRERQAERVALEELTRAVFQQTIRDEPPRAIRELLLNVEPRVVFGYDALREKVLCSDKGIDDRVLEVMKALLYRDGVVVRPAADRGDAPPSAPNTPVQADELRLVEVLGDGAMVFLRLDGEGQVLPGFFQIESAMYESLHGQRDGLRHLCRELFESPWVHCRRLVEGASWASAA